MTETHKLYGGVDVLYVFLYSTEKGECENT